MSLTRKLRNLTGLAGLLALPFLATPNKVEADTHTLNNSTPTTETSTDSTYSAKPRDIGFAISGGGGLSNPVSRSLTEDFSSGKIGEVNVNVFPSPMFSVDFTFSQSKHKGDSHSAIERNIFTRDDITKFKTRLKDQFYGVGVTFYTRPDFNQPSLFAGAGYGQSTLERRDKFIHTRRPNEFITDIDKEVIATATGPYYKIGGDLPLPSEDSDKLRIVPSFYAQFQYNDFEADGVAYDRRAGSAGLRFSFY